MMFHQYYLHGHCYIVYVLKIQCLTSYLTNQRYEYFLLVKDYVVHLFYF